MTEEFNSVATDTSMSRQLFTAALTGDLPATQRLIAAGANLEWRNTSGHTPLMLAATRGHVGVAAALLEAGANVNVLSKTGTSVLSATVGLSDRAMADLLTKHGADPLAGHVDNRKNLLRAAVRWGHEQIFTTLVSNGTDFRFEDRGGGTLLALACKSDQPRILKMLIASGMEVKDEDKNSLAAAESAASHGSDACLRILLDHGVSPDGGDYTSLVYLAAKKGAEKAVALLLERGARHYRREDDSSAPLRVAIKGGHIACVDLLLKHGADPMNEAWEGSAKKTDEELAKGVGGEIEKLVTAAARKFYLVIAAGENDTGLMKTLLDEGVPVDTVDRFGMTALLRAAKERKTEAVKLLLEHQANVNYANRRGHTPLLGALVKIEEYSERPGSDPAMMEMLLARGADPNAVFDKESMLWIAANTKQADAVATLLAHKADPNISIGEDERTPLYAAVSKKDLSMINKLIDAGGRVDIKDKKGVTLLWAAAEEKYADGVAALLTHKADPNTPSGESERTPLYAAVLNKDLGMVNGLIEAGARADVKDKAGMALRAVAESTGDFQVISAIQKQYDLEMEQMGEDASRLNSQMSVFKPFRFKPGVK